MKNDLRLILVLIKKKKIKKKTLAALKCSNERKSKLNKYKPQTIIEKKINY